MDAIATPFVQGRLRNESLSVTVETECRHCGEPISIEIDQDLKYNINTGAKEALVFAPFVDLEKIAEPSIIDGF